ncbi:MAG: LON peptidase substrate-binding domain-containing protein [Myxococcales bacterium]
MDDVERVTAALSRLPIFPLPGAVLLPHGAVPLHIFEPRYRAMTQDCLPRNGGHNVLALAQPSPVSLRSGEDPPRLLPIVGVGTLARLEELPDGRFNLVLKGVLRARIVEELPSGKPYRVVRAVALVDDPVEERDPAVLEAAESLRRLLLALCAAQPGPAAQALAQMSSRAQEPGRLADILAASLIETPSERQAVLEALRVKARIALVSQAVAALLAQATPRAEAKGGFLN